ncbi:MAG: 2-carboxy-1,4-naphthoquinone phytyltransferase, partial [Cyanobacteria bacterium P01_E01_bin.34]
SVAIIPIWVGSAIAWGEAGFIQWRIFWTFVGSAVAILAWLNLTNDVFDSRTGIDKNKAHSIVNLTGNAPAVFAIANLLLALGVAGISAISWWQQDWIVVVIIAIACFLGYTYQGPPFRLGYKGLGEPICWITFGPMAVGAAYYSQAQTWSPASLAVSILIGLSTTLILFCSHFHQVQDDLAAGKRSPIVRLGTALGAKVVTGIVLLFFGFLVGLTIFEVIPIGGLLAIASLPPAIRLVRLMNRHHNNPQTISGSKFIAVAFHFWSGLLLGLGFLIA